MKKLYLGLRRNHDRALNDLALVAGQIIVIVVTESNTMMSSHEIKIKKTRKKYWSDFKMNLFFLLFLDNFDGFAHIDS